MPTLDCETRGGGGGRGCWGVLSTSPGRGTGKQLCPLSALGLPKRLQGARWGETEAPGGGLG